MWFQIWADPATYISGGPASSSVVQGLVPARLRLSQVAVSQQLCSVGREHPRRMAAWSITHCQHVQWPVRQLSGHRHRSCRPQCRRPGRCRASYCRRLQCCAAKEQSPYEVLGVQPDASLADIKRAFRKKALKVHPDVNKEAGAAQEFQACKAAYQTLSDTSRRSSFDRQSQRQQSPSQGGFDWRGWADEAGTRAKEPFYGFTEFFKDLDADLRKRQQRRGSQPKTLYEEFAELGEEFVEWLEGTTGVKPRAGPEDQRAAEQQAARTARDAQAAQEKAAADAAKAAADAAKAAADAAAAEAAAKRKADDDIEDMLARLKAKAK